MNVSNEKLERMILDTLNKIGISAAVRGYRYMRIILHKSVRDPKCLNRITKLYEEIGKQNEVSSLSVERAIRTAIKRAWDIGNHEYINDIFGYSVNSNKGNPTNTEFLSVVTDRITMLANSSKKIKNSITYKLPDGMYMLYQAESGDYCVEKDKIVKSFVYKENALEFILKKYKI